MHFLVPARSFRLLFWEQEVRAEATCEGRFLLACACICVRLLAFACFCLRAWMHFLVPARSWRLPFWEQEVRAEATWEGIFLLACVCFCVRLVAFACFCLRAWMHFLVPARSFRLPFRAFACVRGCIFLFQRGSGGCLFRNKRYALKQTDRQTDRQRPTLFPRMCQQRRSRNQIYTDTRAWNGF